MNQKEKKISVAINYVYHMLAQLLSIAVPLITAPYVSRVLHASGVGVSSYTGAVSYVFSLFAVLGITVYGQREIAFHHDDVKERSIVFWELFLFKLCTSMIVIVAYGVYLTFFISEYKVYYAIQAVTLFSALIDLTWFFQGMEEFKILAIRWMVIRILSVFCIFCFVRNENDIGKYILINVGSGFLACFVLLFGIKSRLCPVRFRELKPLRHLRGIIEFFLPVLAVQLYTHVDKIMLGAIGYVSDENGYYEQARKIVEIVIKIITSINAVLFPRIAFLYAQNRTDEIKLIFRDTYKITILLVLPIVTGLWIISDHFVAWFFGMGYEPVAPLIKLSCPLLVFICIGNFVGVQYLNPTKQQNKATVIYLISAAFNILFNAILIPRMLSVGALLASLIAEFISCTLQVVLLQKSEYRFRMTQGIWKYVLASAVMGVIVAGMDWYLGEGIIVTVAEVITGAVVYFGVLLLLRDQNLAFDYVRNGIRSKKKVS